MQDQSARRRATLTGLSLLGLLATACTDWTVLIPRSGSSGSPDTPSALAACRPQPAATPTQHCARAGESSELPPCEEWVKVQPEGAVCSDGSPYKFFVNYSGKSDNLLVMFEPGGACFDFDTCTRSKLGAVNPNGLADDHVARYADLNLVRRSDDNPTKDWNFVFVSYCTGDVHGGDIEATYPDPAGGPAVTYRHVGARNTRKVIDFLAETFSDVPQLLVTGCSAGGTGATQNYGLIRDALDGVQCGYLLDDSGPIFSSEGPSQTLHAASRAAWNLDPLLSELERITRVEPGAITGDFGRLNTALAQRYPRDRFALTAYQRDLNYSLYSYAVFDPSITLEGIQTNWTTDLLDIKQQYESRRNMGYFIPYFRLDNCSHCATIPPRAHDATTIESQPWLGTEISAAGTDLRQFIDQLLDNTQPVGRSFEETASGDFTPEQAAMCLPK
jgi:hypothetical protein